MGLIHLDAGVLIGLLDDENAHHRSAREVVTQALGRGDRIEMAASTLAETLVAPARLGADAISVVHDACARLPIGVVPLDVGIATEAARVRARHRALRLPDALVIATAAAAGADSLVTTDRRWPDAGSLDLSAEIRLV